MCFQSCENTSYLFSHFSEMRKEYFDYKHFMITTAGRLLCLLPAVERLYRRYVAAHAAMSVLMIVQLYMHGAAHLENNFY